MRKRRQTLIEAAEELAAARRALLDAIAQSFGVYRVLDWMLRWWAPR